MDLGLCLSVADGGVEMNLKIMLSRVVAVWFDANRRWIRVSAAGKLCREDECQHRKKQRRI